MPANLLFFHAVLLQIGSYFGSELLSMDVDGDGHTDVLLVAAPMYYSQGWERGKVYVYGVMPEVRVSDPFSPLALARFRVLRIECPSQRGAN